MAIELAPPQATYEPLLPDSAPHTTADLKYFVPSPDGEVPWHRNYDADAGPITNITTTIYKKPIYDLRPLVDAGKENETDINVTGFQVVPKGLSGTKMTLEEWEDEEVIKKKYYDETIQLLKNVTGATRVEIFDHTIRKKERPGEETPDTPSSRKPVARVHIDQTPASGTKRVHRHTGADAERLLRGKAQLVNVWRPLRGPVLDAPLAVADSRTLSNSDLVPSRLLYRPPTPEGETYQVAYSDRHRWYYLSNMTPQEALLLKCWDNGEVQGARTPHTGFLDDKYKDVEVEQPRWSIEVRALVFSEEPEV